MVAILILNEFHEKMIDFHHKVTLFIRFISYVVNGFLNDSTSEGV